MPNPEIFKKKAIAEKNLKMLLEEVKIVREQIEALNKELSLEYARDYHIKKSHERRL
ncbi:MAG: hypothetical protein ABIA21_01340 [Candidatus Aenigmatarchaeota archaeon]